MTNAEFDAQEKELLNEVPEEFRSALSYMAYESVHSAGQEEVINKLRGLVGDLKPSIEKYGIRMRAEGAENVLEIIKNNT